MSIFSMNARDAKAITKADTAPTYQTPMAAIYCGVGGDVCIVTEGARARGERLGTPFASLETVTITVAAGSYLNVQVYAIKSTGTTASAIIGFYP